MYCLWINIIIRYSNYNGTGISIFNQKFERQTVIEGNLNLFRAISEQQMLGVGAIHHADLLFNKSLCLVRARVYDTIRIIQTFQNSILLVP